MEKAISAFFGLRAKGLKKGFRVKSLFKFCFCMRKVSIFGSGKVIYCRIAALFCNKLLPTGSKSGTL
jgi:hypothetical protein